HSLRIGLPPVRLLARISSRSARGSPPAVIRWPSPNSPRPLTDFGELGEQLGLGRHGLGAGGGTDPAVASVCVELPGLRIVREVRIEVTADASLEILVQDREHDLDAPKEVSVHPIGAGTVDLLVAIVVEVVATGMFEEAADDGAHPDALRNSGNARTQAANSAH